MSFCAYFRPKKEGTQLLAMGAGATFWMPEDASLTHVWVGFTTAS